MSLGSNNLMPDCNHKEADTVVVHMSHALEQGMKTIKVRTVDTDVITILTGAFFELAMIQPQVDIRVAFGMGKITSFTDQQHMFQPWGAKIPRSTSVSCTDWL